MSNPPSIVAFIILLISAVFALDLHYGRETQSHERLVKKAGLGGLDYVLVGTSVDTIDCHPVGDFIQYRYIPLFQDTSVLKKRTSTWSKRDDGLPIRQLSYFDNFFGAQVAEITSTGEGNHRGRLSGGIFVCRLFPSAALTRNRPLGALRPSTWKGISRKPPPSLPH